VAVESVKFDFCIYRVVSYDAWGNATIIGTGTLLAPLPLVGTLNPYRYRGYRYDNETGLMVLSYHSGPFLLYPLDFRFHIWYTEATITASQ